MPGFKPILLNFVHLSSNPCLSLLVDLRFFICNLKEAVHKMILMSLLILKLFDLLFMHQLFILLHIHTHLFMPQQIHCLNDSDLNLTIMFYFYGLQIIFCASRNVLSSKQSTLNF